MSHTAYYTPLHPLDVEPEDLQYRPRSITPGVKILDPDGLDEYLPDWSTEMCTHEHTEREGYPRQQWEVLEGFKTWDFDHFNIERLGFYYDREDAVDFWAGLSEYTEPFQFLTPSAAGDWPHAVDILTGDRIGPLGLHVTCRDGEIWVHELDVQRTDREPVDAQPNAH